MLAIQKYIFLFQAAGGIHCCALALLIWLGFRPLPFAWSPSPCCARVSPMLCGVLIACNALRWSWHWHLKPSIHRCSSLESNSMITWLTWRRVKTVSVCVCVSTRNAKQLEEMSELLKHIGSLTFAYICNGLVVGLNMFETCRVLPF